MALELDTRQRAMLLEMGVSVWLPESAVAVPQRTPQIAPADRTQPRATPSPQPGGHAGASAIPTMVYATDPVAALDWTELTQSVRACQACALCAGRSHVTLLAPASERVRCDWLVLGDPPDEDEDGAGAPFAGPDGVLLDNMLRALGLQRANPLPSAAVTAWASTGAAVPATPARRVYVSNVLKCRPAHGAIPQASELAQCNGWLQREIALVQPKVILSLGRFANQLLLGEVPALAALPLGKLRGTLHRYQGVAVVVSYPPKLLMRNSADKAKAWADWCLAAAAH
jgi:uracil-DNA glycosylase